LGLGVSSLSGSGTTMVAATEGGVFRSTDDGLTWTADRTQPTSLPITCLAVSSTMLLAGTQGNGIWRYPL